MSERTHVDGQPRTDDGTDGATADGAATGTADGTATGTAADTADGTDGDTAEETVPHPSVLDELSRVFARGEEAAGTDRPVRADGSDAADVMVDDAGADASPAGRSAPEVISISGDDDLPDAVYLDEELARESSDGTVFIDDDGSHDAIAPKDAAVPGIEPRLRERRIGVRRAEGRRRLVWSAVALAVVGLVVAVLAVLGSSLFAIDRVDVSGAVYTDPERLQAVVEDLEGTPVLLADTAAAEERLEAIPWVDSARVRTSFPDGATIELRERRPVATMQGADGRFRVLDAEGRVLDALDGQPIALVWIAGPGTLDVEPGEFAPIGPSAAASLVTKLTPDVRTRTESILVTPDGSDLRLLLTNRPLDADGAETSETVDTGALPGGDDEVGGEDTADDTVLAPAYGTIEVRFGSALGDNEQIEKLVRLERQLDDLGDVGVSVIDVSTSEVTVR